MFRQQIDADAIEAYINANKASDIAPARKQFLKNLLAEADKLGLTVYGQDNRLGHLILDISIGDSLDQNAPGELSLTVMNNCVKIENLTINKFSVSDCVMHDTFVHCPQSGLKKFGWRPNDRNNYCSPNDVFDFKLAMLPNWLKKLSETAEAIARVKKQIAKTVKIAEIQADRLQGILEALSVAIQAKLPELKCCVQRFPEQRSFGLWLYNVEVDRLKPGFDDPYKFIFKPAEEYAKFSPDDRVYLETTRRMLDEKKLKPVRMFTVEKCVKPDIKKIQTKFEYAIWFVYDESESNWACNAPTSLPNFKQRANLSPEKIGNWVETLIDAEMQGYEILKDYEDRMTLLAGGTYGRWLVNG